MKTKKLWKNFTKMENLKLLKEKQRRILKEIEYLEKELQKKRNEWDNLDDKISRIEGISDEIEEIKENAKNFTRNKKKRPRPNYTMNFNEEQETRTEKRRKRDNISLKENLSEEETQDDKTEDEIEQPKDQEIIRYSKRNKLDEFVKEIRLINEKGNLDEILKQEEEINNEQQTRTENLVKQIKEIEIITKLAKKSNQIEILKRYNYAESFRIRIEKETANDLSEQTARIKIYKEMNEIMKGDYQNLRKMTQRAEKLYEIINETGGRKIIRKLKITNLSTLLKLTKEQIIYIAEKLEKS
jgi:hypothetical protein